MNKVNILVVDDRPEGILAVQAVLNSPSYNIVTASSGNEALKHLLHQDYAVILLDVQMPLMNGFETASIIKTREKSKDIPIIFMSAINQDEQYVYQGYGVGAIDYLLKPFDPYILRSKVSIYVDIYRKNRLIKEQAQKLRESEARAHAQEIDRLEIENLRRYQNLADSIPQIVFRVNTDGSFDYFNKVWFEYTGLSINSCSGHDWMKVFYPEDLRNLERFFNPTTEPLDHECECRIMNKDGEFRWHLIRIQPDLSAGPLSFSSWLGTATDIEERKKNEEAQKLLSKSGEILSSTLELGVAVEQLPKLIVPYIGDWIVFDVLNEQEKLETVSIYHRDYKKKEYARSIYDSYLANNPDIGVQQVLNTGKKQILNELEFGDMNGAIFPLCLHGRTIGVMSVISDNAGRKFDHFDVSLAEELSRRMSLAFENYRLYKLSQEAIEIRNDFLSIASHELNTPITSLKLQLQMVRKALQTNKDGDFSLSRFSKSVDASVKQVDRLINLIQILLDVSRIQSGKFTFNFEKLDARDVIKEVVERHKEILQNSDCVLHVIDGKNISVTWDKTRVEQVITNLLTNAIKYAPGKIELIVKEQGEDVLISVRDFGRGIPEGKLKTIFERFERATPNDSVSGLGLGLFIVKQIVEGHQGKIEVHSETDKGSTFSIYLPKDAKMESKPSLQEDHYH